MRKPSDSIPPARRPRRSRSEWAAEIDRWRRSGLSATAYAVSHDLSASSLFWWSSHLRDSQDSTPHAATATFLPLRASQASIAVAVPAPFALEITLRNGRTVRAPGDADVARLARVLDALEGRGE